MNFPRLFPRAALAAMMAALPQGRAAFPTVALKPVCLTQIVSPVNICNAGDGSGRLFVCDQRGKIWIIQNAMLQPVPFLDLGSKLVPQIPAYDERGLLGMAFHPNYASGNPAIGGGRFYVFYTASSPNAPGTTTSPVNCRSTIAEYRVSAGNANLADPASARVLLSYDKPQTNHNGGQIDFGPEVGPGGERYLYFSAGDGGGQHDNRYGHTGGSGSTNPGPAGGLGNAQDKTKWLGKIHRIDPLGTNGPGGQYGLPVDNPFVGAGGGVREEIYAYGLRNPWRFSFDAPTGRLFCGDVGQDRIEEVDLVTNGGNYGWHAREGTRTEDQALQDALTSGGDVIVDPPPTLLTLPGGETLIEPIAEYEHLNLAPSEGLTPIGASITGGCVYRGSGFPALVGKYLFADWGPTTAAADANTGTMLGLEESGGFWTMSVLGALGQNLLGNASAQPIGVHIAAFGRDEQGELYIATKITRGPSDLDPATSLPTGGIYKIVPPGTTGSVVLTAVKDNTMFEDPPANSDGQGVHLFSGLTDGGQNGDYFFRRRALLAFNPAGALPANATLTSAQVTLKVTRSVTSAAQFSLHKAVEDWGEGASNPGSTQDGVGAPALTNDATWFKRFYPATDWTTAGGSFVATPSATQLAGTSGFFTWSGAGLMADVQGWISAPAGNFGWVLKADDEIYNPPVNPGNAKQFASRNDPTAANRPKLTLGYATPIVLTRREAWLQQYFYVGQFVDDLADLDGDGIPNLVEYAFGNSPKSLNTGTANVVMTATPAGANTIFTTTFRRDPRATDLTCQLQTSPDLVTWTTVVQSVAGAVPTGAAFFGEADVAGTSPIKLVTAQEVTASARRFARLRVTR